VGTAIQLYGSGNGVTIVGNKIGLDANDVPVLGSIIGISSVHYFYPNGIQNVVIGGSAQGEGNDIAGHLSAGISVTNTYSGVRISGNSIHDNGDLGIDLITTDFQTGVTVNDPLDADSGGNGLQNFPVIESASQRRGSSLRVAGTLNSNPSSSFALEFFASPQSDASGFGEGQVYLGSTTVSTNSSGMASFVLNLPVNVKIGWFVASTATNTSSGSTSEFSGSVVVRRSGSIMP
jgi:hypothetical protein